jgi:aspartate kinase
VNGIVVQKYGGSSVADARRIKQVAERIVSTQRAGKKVVVVVSAMGDTTDDLLARAREIAESPPRRELDMLLTCGERAAMALLSMAVSELGCEAISFTGSQSGIMTNDRHSGARIVEVRPFRVQDELERGRIVIVAGFQGVSYKREITTLGRGGSDTTAVALAAALRADYCEICSDVEGVYSADPRIVGAAELLRAVDYDQMAELAAHGARVLHPDAVEFARRSGVALWARATASDGAGTRVDGIGDSGAAAGVAGQKQLVMLSAAGPGSAERLLSVAQEAGISPLRLEMEPTAGRLTFCLDDVPDWPAIRRTLGAVEVVEGLGAVSVVGGKLGGNALAIGRLLAAARAEALEVRGVVTSPLRVTLVCAERDVDRLVACAHATIRREP